MNSEEKGLLFVNGFMRDWGGEDEGMWAGGSIQKGCVIRFVKSLAKPCEVLT
ncbi:hypothetical protein VDG1235_3819 [Verrucomicrobiia bacterium DG1235]|nr:hypothetical protein VDG1235_3819 [Verrucomicrobiae bacterium DG1235]